MISSLMLSAALTSSFYDVPVTRVIDGDTFRVDLGEGLPEIFRHVSVRMNGINTGELSAKRKCERRDAERARQVLIELIGTATVDLYFCTLEKYGRLLCEIRVNDYWASEYMLSRRVAVAYTGSKKPTWICIK